MFSLLTTETTIVFQKVKLDNCPKTSKNKNLQLTNALYTVSKVSLSKGRKY